MDSSGPKQKTTTESQSFPFDRLLPEIQLLVWEAALPPRRIFHVREAYTGGDAGGFRFHIRHAPPSALSVCHASRDALHRRGIFLDGDSGAWFRPDTDMLYFDRNQRHAFRTANKRRLSSSSLLPSMPSSPSPDTILPPPPPHWAAIQHVGLEWRAFFSRTPRLEPGQANLSSAWRDALAPLRAAMPSLRTVTYVLPMVRHAGGVSFGREPYGAQRFEAELVRLPEETGVPWGDSLVLDQVPTGPVGGRAQRGLAELLDGRRSYLVPWRDIKAIIDGSLNISEEDEEEDDGDGDGKKEEEVDWRDLEERPKKRELPKLDLTGCWLLRVNAEYEEEVSSFSR